MCSRLMLNGRGLNEGEGVTAEGGTLEGVTNEGVAGEGFTRLELARDFGQVSFEQLLDLGQR